MLFALELCVIAQPGDGATAPSIEKHASLPFASLPVCSLLLGTLTTARSYLYNLWPEAATNDSLSLSLISLGADGALSDSSLSQPGLQ